MRDRYPAIEPYDSGRLPVSDGHEIYWETCGNPEGAPALVLHGGPGSGCGPGLRRWFDPARYRIILFDQRGCGRSRPLASEPEADLTANTTPHQFADIEALRQHLGVERWLLFGGSWGCALGLAYAERHPERVSGIVMMGIATGDQSEMDLLTRDLGRWFPEAWTQFRDHLPPEDRDGDLAAGYASLLSSRAPSVHQAAADAWCRWEDAIAPGSPSWFEEPAAFRLGFARLVAHYFAHGCWFEPGEVLANAARLAGIPGVLVQGRLDPNNLVGTPWLLERAWPGVELRIVDAGHDMRSPEMVDALIEATDRLCPAP